MFPDNSSCNLNNTVATSFCTISQKNESYSKFSSTKFLIKALLEEQGKSEFFREKLVKGIRNNFFYVIDITKNSLERIKCDDKDAYT